MKKGCFLFVVVIALSLICSVKASPDGWVSPTGHETPTDWASPEKAYDDDLLSMATTAYIGTGDYSSFLVMTLSSAISCTKIRFYASRYVLFPPYGTQIDVDVYDSDSSSWIYVFEGDYTGMTWQEKDLDQERNVLKIRVRFHAIYTGQYRHLYEVAFWEIEGAQEYSFTFSETISFSDSSFMWKEKAFQFNETVTFSDSSFMWKERLFRFSETVSFYPSVSMNKELFFQSLEFINTETIYPHVSLRVTKELALKFSEHMQTFLSSTSFKEKRFIFSQLINTSIYMEIQKEMQETFIEILETATITAQAIFVFTIEALLYQILGLFSLALSCFATTLSIRKHKEKLPFIISIIALTFAVAAITIANLMVAALAFVITIIALTFSLMRKREPQA